MKVTIIERVILMGIIPREGNIIDMNNAQNIRKVTQFSPEELDALKMVQNEKGMQWDAEAANKIGEKDIVVGVSGAELIKKTLMELSDEEKLPIDALSLYRKFVDADLTIRDDSGKIVREETPDVLDINEGVKGAELISTDRRQPSAQEFAEAAHQAVNRAAKVRELDEVSDKWSDQAEQDKIIGAEDAEE